MDIFEAVSKGDFAAVENLLVTDPDVVNAVNPSGIRPLLQAVYVGQKELAYKLRQKMDSINVWEAAALGDLTAMKELSLVESGLLDAVAPDGFTPLGLASFFGQLPVLEWLLLQGADPNIPAQNQMAVYPIHSSAANRNQATALTGVRLLIAYGAKVNVAQRGGWTPLHQAADHGHRELVDLLLEVGADRTLKSTDGRTPVDMAAEKGFEKVAALLR